MAKKSWPRRIVKGQLRLSGGKKLNSPRGAKTRPTTSRVREAVMNILSGELDGCNWLDICSGTGIMGCEALKRGAKKIIAIEINKKTSEICNSNLRATADEVNHNNFIEVINSDAVSWLKGGCLNQTRRFNEYSKDNDHLFDFIYLDPPYKSKIYLPILQSLIKGKWLKNNSLVICEHSTESMLSIPSGWVIKDRRVYGSSGLVFITPNQALSSLYGTDSMQPQISLEEL